MTDKQLESKLESNCERYAKNNGFLFRKYTSPSNNGVPDRILMGHGSTIFVELKRKGKVPRKLQEKIIEEMEDATAIVAVIDNDEDFQKLCQDIIAGIICNPINENALNLLISNKNR